MFNIKYKEKTNNNNNKIKYQQHGLFYIK